MIRPTAILKTSPRSTRMLVRVHDDDVLKAALMAPPSLHPRALPTLLEALSLWHQAPVRVVLCAAEAESWCRLGLLDEMWTSLDTVHYTVELRGLWRDPPRRIDGFGDFRDLRRLAAGGAR
jgi:hypothetical protein